MELPELVSDQELEDRDVVANSLMNRQRGLAGVNSYEKELGVNPIDVLSSRIDTAETRAVVRWLDVCCGTGLALVQGAHGLKRLKSAAEIQLVGIDLVDMFDPGAASVDVLEVFCTSMADWQPDSTFDLITCVHGLHYLGDKLGALARLASWVNDDGLLIANFDAASVLQVDGGRSGSMSSALRSVGFELDIRRHRISLRGGRRVHLPYRYLGADPNAGPNYTGQPAVRSFYETAD